MRPETTARPNVLRLICTALLHISAHAPAVKLWILHALRGGFKRLVRTGRGRRS